MAYSRKYEGYKEFLLNKICGQKQFNYTRNVGETMALIRECQEKGLIAKRNDAYYLNLPDNKEPMCENGEVSTFNVAAKYLNAKKRQDLLFTLQARVKE